MTMSNAQTTSVPSQDDNHPLTPGQRLAALRKAKGWTTQQLADHMTAAGAKVSRAAISNWERGTNGIVSSKLPVLARLLDCSESYLLSGIQPSVAQVRSPTTPPTHFNELPRANSSQTDLSHSHFAPTNALNTRYHYEAMTMQPLKKSDKLQHVCYDIRGPLLQTANQLEAQGHRIIRLNIGNPAPFGFEAPQEILSDVAINLPNAIGYSDSQGIFAARKAILQYYQAKGLHEAVDVSDVYIGNGVSELIVMTMQAMLNDGDEVLIPMPDYPLWTAATNLAGGRAVHYLCNEEDNWQPISPILNAKSRPTPRALW